MTLAPTSPMDVHEGETLGCSTCGAKVEAGHGVLSPAVADLFKTAHTDKGHSTYIERAQS